MYVILTSHDVSSSARSPTVMLVLTESVDPASVTLFVAEPTAGA